MNNIQQYIFPQVFVAVFILAVSAFLGIDDKARDSKSISYIRKNLFLIYLFVGLFFHLSKDTNQANILLINIMFILLVNLIAGTNMAYSLGLLEKELGKIDIAIYSSWKYFFESKQYISICIVIVLFVYNSVLKWFVVSDEKVMLSSSILLLAIFFYHNYSIVIDRFGVISFDETLDKIQYKNKDNRKKLLDRDNRILELLCFIVLVEDIDFFSRKKIIYSPLHVFKRKTVDFKNSYKALLKKEGSTNTNFKGIHIFKIKKQILSKIKILIIIFEKVNYNLRTNILYRGYSTIGQQILRKNAMQEYSYDYRIRRKLFVEWIYTHYFIKAYIKRKAKDKSMLKGPMTDKIIMCDVKIELLLYYYEMIGCPNSMEELMKCLSKESALSVKELEYQRKKFNVNNENNMVLTELMNCTK